MLRRNRQIGERLLNAEDHVRMGLPDERHGLVPRVRDAADVEAPVVPQDRPDELRETEVVLRDDHPHLRPYVRHRRKGLTSGNTMRR